MGGVAYSPELAGRTRGPRVEPPHETPGRRTSEGRPTSRSGPCLLPAGLGSHVDRAAATTESWGAMDDAIPSSDAASRARMPSPTPPFVWTAAALAIVAGFGLGGALFGALFGPRPGLWWP